MKKLVPVGPRIFIKEVMPTTDLVARAAAAGLHAVVYEENEPAPTEGIVVAVGTDPLIQELCREGDHVFFDRLAGTYQYYNGDKYRVLTIHQITSVEREDGPTPVPDDNPYPR